MNSETNKSSSLKRKKIKLKWLFSLPRTSKKFDDQKNIKSEKLCKSVSSFDINDKEKQPKQTMFSTLKRNFQSKFSPNHRKIVAENTIIPNVNERLFVEPDNLTIEQENRIYENVPLPEINLTLNNSTIQIENTNIENSDVQAEEESNSLETTIDITEQQIINAKLSLTKYGWYWGSLSRNSAQRTLAGKSNGSFLVRNSETDKLQFTLSFRSAGVTLHNRINYFDGFWHIESLQYHTIVELFEDTIKKSEECVFCYVKPVNIMLPPVPVRLTNPVNRYYEVSSLQHLCRFVIRSKLDSESLTKLPLLLPNKLKAYVEENFYENI